MSGGGREWGWVGWRWGRRGGGHGWGGGGAPMGGRIKWLWGGGGAEVVFVHRELQAAPVERALLFRLLPSKARGGKYTGSTAPGPSCSENPPQKRPSIGPGFNHHCGIWPLFFFKLSTTKVHRHYLLLPKPPLKSPIFPLCYCYSNYLKNNGSLPGVFPSLHILHY